MLFSQHLLDGQVESIQKPKSLLTLIAKNKHQIHFSGTHVGVQSVTQSFKECLKVVGELQML